MVDLNMLVITKGRERTKAESQVLLHRAGFMLTHIVPTASPFSVIEAQPGGHPDPLRCQGRPTRGGSTWMSM